MKITFPHMGQTTIGITTIFNELGMDVVPPPATTTRTLSLGVTHAPEFACLPLKICLGNYLEAIEQGADMVLMVGGSGPCRFGYYGEIQREILKGIGQQVEFFIIEPPHGGLRDFIHRLRQLIGGRSWGSLGSACYLAWHKMRAVERLQQEAMLVRPITSSSHALDNVYKLGVGAIERADGLRGTQDALGKALEQMSSLPQVDYDYPPLQVGIVGEIYTVLEPFANLNIIKNLGELGAQVHQSIYITDWLGSNLFLTAIGLCSSHEREVRQAAKPYLDHFIGGHGQDTVGQTVVYSRQGYDGVIHLLPFTCMPEIAAQSILPQVSHELDIPILTLVLDEQSAKAGIQTRLEAFIDLLRHRQAQRFRMIV